MGLFGSSYQTTYNTSTQPLYDDKVAGIIKQSVISSVQGNRNMSSTLRDNILNSVVTSAEGLYRYGNTGAFPWGLPDTATTYVPEALLSRVKLSLENELGHGIEVTYSSLEVIIDPAVQEPSTPNLVIPEDNSWYDNAQPPLQNQDTFYLVEYRELDEDGQFVDELVYHKWWLRLSDATAINHPTLMPNVSVVENPYYPIIPLVINRERYDIDSSPYKRYVRRAGNFLGVDVQDIGDALEEETNKASEDGFPFNPIEDAFIFMGTPIATEDPLARAYLFNFFDKMNVESYKEFHYDYWEAHHKIQGLAPPLSSFYLKDTNFFMEFGWNYIKKTVHNGVLLGDNGKPLKRFQAKSEYTSGADNYFGSLAANFISTSEVAFMKPLTDSTYEKIVVHGLVFSTNCVGKTLRVKLDDAFDVDSKEYNRFVIPMRRDILKQMGKIQSHDVMHQSIRVMINDQYRRKKKWYESGWFQVVTIVVAIAASILTWNPGTGLAILSATQIAVNLAILVLAMVLRPVVIKALEDVIGEEFAAVVASVAVIVAGQYAGATITGAEVATGLTAVQGIQLGIEAISAYQTMEFKDDMEDIQNEIAAVYEATEEIYDELDVLDDLSGMALANQFADTNRILDVNNYVTDFQGKVYEPLLSVKTTSSYVEAKRYTGRLYTPINSAPIL